MLQIKAVKCGQLNFFSLYRFQTTKSDDVSPSYKADKRFKFNIVAVKLF